MTKVEIMLSTALVVLLAVLNKPALAIKKQPYIVYLGAHSHIPTDLDLVTELHTELLSSLLGSEDKANDALIYSYQRYINAFSALLDDEEAAEIAKHPGVVSVFLDQGKKLHTSHSWEFLHLEMETVVSSSSLWKRTDFGKDVIIANLDTGVWPESKSFSDLGFDPIPSKWKGTCELNETNNEGRPLCNRKLIGARYFNRGFTSQFGKLNSSYHTVRDTQGHGTHTLSTAAGNFVSGASILGFKAGTIKGGSPHARAASYKVCWPPVNDSECFDSDIMQGFEAAIHDGVDVLSLSLGGIVDDYFNDSISIASFQAIKKGIVVVASAGNSGPDPATLSNVAPWIITVGASTIDRKFQANVKLGNGLVLKGVSLSKPLPEDRLYPLVYSASVNAPNVSVADAKLCLQNTMDPEKVKGKIVVCLRGKNGRVEKGLEAARAGAAGLILSNDKKSGNDIVADPHFLPATHISYKDGLSVYSYINKTTMNPEAFITPPKSIVNIKPAPSMAAFSSRGPNTLTPEILKPDITAPGVNIIASYSEAGSPTSSELDTRRTPFLELSGTSMSCPHVAGVVGLLKSLHPDWSPAAIRSAIMTSARSRNNAGHPVTDHDGKKATPLDYGNGHINPSRAADPGLVYDLTVADYLDFLCGLNYTQEQISKFAGSYHDCPNEYSVLDFNNPAVAVPRLAAAGSVTVTRVLKNVGEPGKYVARVRSPAGFSVTVEPAKLKFDDIGEEKSFKLTIKTLRPSKGYVFGHLTWSDGRHHVRTPIALSSTALHLGEERMETFDGKINGRTL